MRRLMHDGVAAIAACALLGCGASVDRGEEDIHSAKLELREAETVLGFEAADSWQARGATALHSDSRVQGEASVAVDAFDRVTLTSAPFRFERTPNELTLSLQRRDAAPVAAAAELTAFARCAESDQRELIGSAQFHGGKPGLFDHVRIDVSAETQSKLAGGCQRLTLELELDATGAPGTYLFDALALRAQTPQIEEVATALCGMPESDAMSRVGVETPAGYMNYQAWMAEAVPQAEMFALEAALEPYTDVALEPTFDHASQQVVVPVDADEFAAGRVRDALQQAHIALPIRVQTACHTASELKAAAETIAALNWHRSAREVALGFVPDPASGQLAVTFETGRDAAMDIPLVTVAGSDGALSAAERAVLPMQMAAPLLKHESVAAALQERLGSLVRVQWGHPARSSRASDAAPHFGAAVISAGGFNCSSGFIAVRNGVRGSVTAGHCWANGTAVTSGAHAYGTIAGRAAFPTFDMERITAAGAFDRKIYTDPGAPTSRTQTGKINAPVGALVCADGAVSGAKCSVQVMSNNAQLCDVSGCTPNLTQGMRAGHVINQGGDSGSPMYSPSGASGATIVGMAIGHITSPADVVWHRISVVEATLGVTVAL